MKLLSIKLKIVILIIGLIIISVGDVYGADWKLYWFHEKLFAYYDAQSITHPSKNIVRVWTRTDYTEKSAIDMVGKLGKKYENLSYTIILCETNCVKKMSRFLSGTYYDNRGGVIDSSNSPSEWFFIIPKSVGDSLYEEICK